jgi:predicted dehydrogenase
MGNIINIGVIGYGYWGPNLVRNFVEMPGVQVRTVSDFKPELLTKVQARYPAIQITRDCQDIFTDPKIDALSISFSCIAGWQTCAGREANDNYLRTSNAAD